MPFAAEVDVIAESFSMTVRDSATHLLGHEYKIEFLPDLTREVFQHRSLKNVHQALETHKEMKKINPKSKDKLPISKSTFDWYKELELKSNQKLNNDDDSKFDDFEAVDIKEE